MDALLSGLEALDRELQSSEAGEDSIKMPPRPPESMTMESFVEHRVPLRVVRDSLSVSLAHGLSRDTVHRRIEELGYNEPPEGLPPPRCFAFWGGGFPPSDAWWWTNARERSATQVRVLRDGRLVRLPSAKLVLGDVVLLEAGDVAPADLRVLVSDCAEAEMEALAGERATKSLSRAGTDPSPLRSPNVLITHCHVIAGRVAAIVVRLGQHSPAQTLVAAGQSSFARTHLRPGEEPPKVPRRAQRRLFQSLCEVGIAPRRVLPLFRAARATLLVLRCPAVEVQAAVHCAAAVASTGRAVLLAVPNDVPGSALPLELLRCHARLWTVLAEGQDEPGAVAASAAAHGVTCAESEEVKADTAGCESARVADRIADRRGPAPSVFWVDYGTLSLDDDGLFASAESVPSAQPPPSSRSGRDPEAVVLPQARRFRALVAALLSSRAAPWEAPNATPSWHARVAAVRCPLPLMPALLREARSVAVRCAPQAQLQPQVAYVDRCTPHEGLALPDGDRAVGRASFVARTSPPSRLGSTGPPSAALGGALAESAPRATAGAAQAGADASRLGSGSASSLLSPLPPGWEEAVPAEERGPLRRVLQLAAASASEGSAEPVPSDLESARAAVETVDVTLISARAPSYVRSHADALLVGLPAGRLPPASLLREAGIRASDGSQGVQGSQGSGGSAPSSRGAMAPAAVFHELDGITVAFRSLDHAAGTRGGCVVS